MKARFLLFSLIVCGLAFLLGSFYTRTAGPALQKTRPIGLLVQSRTIEQTLVAGIMVGDVGYGTATIKKLASVEIEVR